MDLSQTERNYALEWENVPKATRAKKHWSLLWWVPAVAAFFMVWLGYPWWACMGVACFCALNASKEATVKNLKLIPSLLKGLLTASKEK